ncbi:MAG: glycosyltransferase family 4 protein [Patescibacteria group bacterium]
MRLLVLTQKIDKNDLNLGFFHRWLEAMSSDFESVEAVALGLGEYNLPNNICVHSLGKEKGISRLAKIINFYRLIFSLRGRYDAVFIHMNPEYAVLGGMFWKLWEKPIYLWYVHKSITWKLRLASFFAKQIFTANFSSCRLANRKKIAIVGHGIDTNLFVPRTVPKDEKFTVLAAGRMSPVKKYETVLAALNKINGEDIKKIKLLIIAPILDQAGENYKDFLFKKIKDYGLEDAVQIIPGVREDELANMYNKADLLVHTSETGSVDKVVLGAMASELPVLSSSEAFDFLPAPHRFKKINSESGEYDELAEKIVFFMRRRGEKYPELRDIVEKYFSLSNLFKKIKEKMEL